MSTDQEGNLYVAEVDAGRFQKFRPRPGANPAYSDRQARLLGLEVGRAFAGSRAIASLTSDG